MELNLAGADLKSEWLWGEKRSFMEKLQCASKTKQSNLLKRILLDNREYLALNVYVALCYYKLDYYDVSQVR